ncbi:MAG: ADP-ribosylglycohydrolase family protein [Gammaproteobacteria bacterium]|nr:MAG: ADP-ribosylglycohydrolase family protein [Gammaproteobacteria bacterium]
MNISRLIFLLPIFLLSFHAKAQPPKFVTISAERLQDKIKGGWAGQVIGCTYGGPTEFKYTGGLIPDNTPIEWSEGYVKWWYDNVKSLYDDVYMDLTFVDVFERLGMDAPVDSFAMAFATAEYRLWHANQAARYNILQGIKPPQSGHWLNNPHADDLDYQIEADFAGLMSPGMPNTASNISDKIGHIMNYGDGWYGGVYVGAMYSLAFVSDDIEFIVTEALKTIPKQSKFYQCINDVITWYKKYPNDFKQTWFEVEKKWNSDIGCPRFVFNSSNIDATINSAYIVIGLLYGGGDYFKTLDISTRCGQDSDCNPASAGGILGTVLGYSNIPEYWMKELRVVEDIDFAFTNISLNKAYQYSYKHALEMIRRNGGSIKNKSVTIKYQAPVAVQYEVAFPGMYPVQMIRLQEPLVGTKQVPFEGTGLVFKGELKCDDIKYVAELEFRVDDTLVEIVKLPAVFHGRRQELCWKYQLPKGKHTATLKWKNPRPDAKIEFADVLIYSDKPFINHYPDAKIGK